MVFFVAVQPQTARVRYNTTWVCYRGRLPGTSTEKGLQLNCTIEDFCKPQISCSYWPQSMTPFLFTKCFSLSSVWSKPQHFFSLFWSPAVCVCVCGPDSFSPNHSPPAHSEGRNEINFGKQRKTITREGGKKHLCCARAHRKRRGWNPVKYIPQRVGLRNDTDKREANLIRGGGYRTSVAASQEKGGWKQVAQSNFLSFLDNVTASVGVQEFLNFFEFRLQPQSKKFLRL